MNDFQMRILAEERTRQMHREAQNARLARSGRRDPEHGPGGGWPHMLSGRPRNALRVSLEYLRDRVTA